MPTHAHSGEPHHSDSSGAVTLLSTIIVAAIGVGITVTLLTLSVDLSRSSTTLTASHTARGLADACAEYALNKLRITSTYIGNEAISFSSGSCHIETISASGTIRTIKTWADVASSTRRALITISQMQPSLVISSWQEVADF